MSRIVAGTAGGRALRVPASGTRPTSDRVREALFSRLEHWDVVEGARVLDLYAGSGALGLEAASRGAASVVLVESSARAAAVCARNARELGLPAVRVVTRPVERFLRGAPAQAQDLVFLDPPYDLPAAELDAVLAALVPWITPGGVVVVERSARSREPHWPDAWQRTDDRRYGETVVWFAASVTAP